MASSSAILDQLDAYGPTQCPQLSYEQAAQYTRELAKSHYENFSVVSWFLPKRLREDFRHVYSFCRWADDLGDETGDPERSLELLAWWRTELDRCYDGVPRHPVFVALWPTIQKHDIPRKPFDDLVDAFVQDQRINRYENWPQVLDYCTRSADPVGRLVLYLCGYRDQQRQQLSDATCTALQLANFWQDVRRDILERNRVYIPADVAAEHGLDIDLLVAVVRADAIDKGEPCCSMVADLPTAGVSAILPAYRSTVRELVNRTWPLFEKGKALWPMVASDVRLDIELFSRGGEAVLRMIEKEKYNTLERRPSVNKPTKIMMMMGAVVRRLLVRSPETSSGDRS